MLLGSKDAGEQQFHVVHEGLCSRFRSCRQLADSTDSLSTFNSLVQLAGLTETLANTGRTLTSRNTRSVGGWHR